jgi:hypothetical protein
MRSTLAASLTLATLVLGACRGDESSPATTTTDAGTDADAGVDNPTAIKCPFPTTPKGFVNEDSQNVLETGRLFMNEDQDAWGLPGALAAFQGKMQRGVRNYIVGKVFAGEKVSLWVQNASGVWEQSGASINTDGNGLYSFATPASLQAKNTSTHAYVLLEGDGSCAEHGAYAWPSGTKIVVTDIDGTMTKSNAEFQTQVTQPSYVPLEHPSATAAMTAWKNKGYRVVFLSARPDNFRDATRVWLRDKNVNFGPIVTAKTFVTGPAAVDYKTKALQKMVTDNGWQIVAAYGNEASDVQAYAAVNVPKSQTFTVENANGIEQTQGLAGNDFAPHITNYVNNQPDAQQP